MLLEANAVRNNLEIDYFSSVGFFMTVITSRCIYCILLLLINSLSSRKISLFNTFHSIDILPGPVNSKLIDTPTGRKIPPITSYRLIGIASSGERPILPKKLGEVRKPVAYGNHKLRTKYF